MKAKKIYSKELDRDFKSIIDAALFMQENPRYNGKKYEGYKIGGTSMYNRISMHLNKTPYKRIGEKEYLIKSVFGITFEFKGDK